MSVAWQRLNQAYGSSLDLPDWFCTDSVQHPAALVSRVQLWEVAQNRQMGPAQFIHWVE
jgi:hypothetical protein